MELDDLATGKTHNCHISNPKNAQTFWRNVVQKGVDINEDRVVCISCSNQSLYFFVFLVFVFLARINLCIWKVSTWFANARRRLKKENKMTWEPKNKLDDEDVDVSDDDDRDHSFNRDDKSGGERKVQISAQH